MSNNFEFSIDINDTIFILTRNGSFYKDNVNNLHSKMIVIREFNSFNLDNISKVLNFMDIKKLNIFSINNNSKQDTINTVISEKDAKVIYAEMKAEYFIDYLNYENINFLDYNRDSMYILRDGNFIDIKNIFTSINGCCVNVGRGASQKAHIISPLDLRLTSYLMAMFNLNYKLISNLNTFNYISKDRYLSWKDSKDTTIFRNLDLDKESKLI